MSSVSEGSIVLTDGQLASMTDFKKKKKKFLLGEAMLLLNLLVVFSKIKETCGMFSKTFLTYMSSITRILTQTVKIMNYSALFELL